MFHVMRNGLQRGTNGVRPAVDALRQRVPPGWSADIRVKGTEELLTLKGSDGRQATLTVLSRRTISPKDVRVPVAGETSHSAANAGRGSVSEPSDAGSARWC